MKKLFKLLLITAFFNALSWIVLIPIWQYPDEQAHFAQIQDAAELGKTPVDVDTSEEIAVSEKIFGTARDGFGNNHYTYHPQFNIDYSDTSEGLFENYIESLDKSSRTNLVKKEATHNPPLYYFLGALFYKAFGWGDLFTRVYAVRVMSAILFLALVFVAYKIASIIFENEILQITLPALIAFKPMLVFASTGVLPDSLTNFLFTFVILISLLIIKKGLLHKYFLFVTILVVLGSITRQQFLIALPILAIAVLSRTFIEKKVKLIFSFLAFILLFVFLSFIFPSLRYLQNFSLPEIGSPQLSLLFSKNFVRHLRIFLVESNNQTFAWYWGVYRWLSLASPPVIYQIIRVLVLLSLSGLFIKIIKDIFYRNFKESINLYFLITASLIYAGILIIWDYFFRLDHGFSFGLQGRYLFPLIVAQLSILLFGLNQFFEFFFQKYARYLILALVVLMILFNDLSIFYVASSYYDTSSLATFINQASQYKPQIFKGISIIAVLATNLALQVIFLFRFRKWFVENSVAY